VILREISVIKDKEYVKLTLLDMDRFARLCEKGVRINQANIQTDNDVNAIVQTIARLHIALGITGNS
jgi:hypothetical protein